MAENTMPETSKPDDAGTDVGPNNAETSSGSNADNAHLSRDENPVTEGASIETGTSSSSNNAGNTASLSRGDKFRLGLRNSIKLFHEAYEGLDEALSPIADPGVSPELADSPHIESLLAECQNIHPGFCELDYPLIRRSPKKQKVLRRLQLEDDEGIVSTHKTIFPKKLNRKSSLNLDINSEHFYDMSSFPRGTLTILNVINFRQSSGMSNYPRHGTDRDADGLASLFLELGFIVERYDNPTKKIAQSALDEAASDEKSSCCACAVLSHGENGMVYTTDGPLEISEIAKTFRRPNLAGKPKIFLFQTCQGCHYIDNTPDEGPFDGAPERNDNTPDNDTSDVHPEKNNNVSLPCDADFLYAYSTVPGYFSWRNRRQGSWFIQALCSVFRQNAHIMDVYRMLIRVNDQIMSKCQTSTKTPDNTDDRRKIASVVSQMRKDLFFFPPYGPLPLIKRFDSYI